MTEKLAQLADRYLDHPHALLGDAIPYRSLQLAAICFGIGFDHFQGETAIAIIDESQHAQAALKALSWLDGRLTADFFDGVVFTDRRFIGGAPAVSVPYETIRGAQAHGGTLPSVEIWREGSETTQVTIGAAEPTAAFLQAINLLEPADRKPAQRPLVEPSMLDPLGLKPSLVQRPAGADERARQLMEIIIASHERRPEVNDAIALDLAQRAVLFDRNVHRGRGTQSGHLWVSPLYGPDLACAFREILGTPTDEHTSASGMLRMEFRFDDNVAQSALSRIAKRSRDALSGFDWQRMPDDTLVNIDIAGLGAFSGFTIKATTGNELTAGVHGEDLALRQYVLELLPVLEGQFLLLRSLYGWNTEPSQLLDVKTSEAAAHAREQAGFTNLSAFLPNRVVPSEPPPPPPPVPEGLTPEIQAAVNAEVSQLPALAFALQSLSPPAGQAPQPAAPAEPEAAPEAPPPPQGERQEAARRAWAEAKTSNDPGTMTDAALRLHQAQLYDESIAAYTHIADTFPDERGEAAYLIGSSYVLRSILDPQGLSEAHAETLEVALSWFFHAMEHGYQAEYCDENFWEASRALAEVAPRRQRRVAVVEGYLSKFPNGLHATDAATLLKQLLQT